MTLQPGGGRLHALVAASHPKQRRPLAQVLVLLLAAFAGVLIGVALLTADRSSWSGSRTASAAITGRSDTGVLAVAGGRSVVLHLASVPPRGTRMEVEISPDGRARPVSYRQTAARALRSGVLLAVGLAALVQLYRLLVTRPSDSTTASPP